MIRSPKACLPQAGMEPMIQSSPACAKAPAGELDRDQSRRGACKLRWPFEALVKEGLPIGS